MANYKVKVDFSGVHGKFSENNIRRGKYAMANQMLSDMNNFVPYDTGNLRNSGRVGNGGSEVIWDTPYAHRMYNGSKSWNYTTPGTGPGWDDRAKGLYGKQWVDVFKKGAKF